jgi:hypothetical protein
MTKQEILPLIAATVRGQWEELVSMVGTEDLDGMTFQDFCDEVWLALPEPLSTMI